MVADATVGLVALLPVGAPVPVTNLPGDVVGFSVESLIKYRIKFNTVLQFVLYFGNYALKEK